MAEPEGPVVARIGGDPIGVLTVGAELEAEPRAPGSDERHTALERVIVRRLAAAEARRRGLPDRPELRARLDALPEGARARRDALLRDALFREVRDGVALREAALREHYAATKGRYVERRLELRRQTFPTREAARQADVELGASGRLPPGASETLGPAPAEALPEVIVSEALHLREPGERVVIEREGGAALVELVAVDPAAPRPFEAVRERVETSLRTLRGQAAFRELVAELRAEAGVSIDETVLEDDEVWAASAPGVDGPSS